MQYILHRLSFDVRHESGTFIYTIFALSHNVLTILKQNGNALRISSKDHMSVFKTLHILKSAKPILKSAKLNRMYYC